MEDSSLYNDNKDPDTLLNERFLSLFIAHQRRIFAFIVVHVPNAADAEDILQETGAIMWRKFMDFEEGTDFVSWGIAIARNRILKFRHKQKSSWLSFDTELTERIAPYIENVFANMDDRIRALEQCLAKLDEKDRKLIKMRYENKTTTKKLAEDIGRSVHGLYKTLARIHNVLYKCVSKALHTWEVA